MAPKSVFDRQAPLRNFTEVCSCAGFRMPADDDGAACTGPASESRQGTNPRVKVRWKRRTLCYGDLVDAEGVSKRSQCARERVIVRLMGNRRCRGWWRQSLGVVVAG